MSTKSLDIPVSSVRATHDTQVRVAMSDTKVEEYAELMRDGVVFPAIDVIFDGSEYWLASGFHRLAAAKVNRAETIRAHVRPGVKRDALLFAAGANRDHGLPMSIADKRRAVSLMLDDPEIAEILTDPDDDTWSARKIAKHIGVSHPFVSNMIAERERMRLAPVIAQTSTPPQPVPTIDDTLDFEDAPQQVGQPVESLPAPPRRVTPPIIFKSPSLVPLNFNCQISWSYYNHEGIEQSGMVTGTTLSEMPLSMRRELAKALLAEEE